MARRCLLTASAVLLACAAGCDSYSDGYEDGYHDAQVEALTGMTDDGEPAKWTEAIRPRKTEDSE